MSKATHSISLIRTLQRRAYSQACRTTLWTIAIFGICSYFFHGYEQRQQAQSLAAVTAISLTPSANGDLSDSVLRLLQDWDRIRAVATLDAGNRVMTVLPSDPAFRKVAQQAVDSGKNWSEMSTRKDDAHEQILAVVVPLQYSHTSFVRRVVVVLEHNFDWVRWIKMNLYFMAIVASVNIAFGISLASWFTRKVGYPVRELVGVATTCKDGTDLPANLRSDRWEEFALLYDALWRVNRELASHYTNVRRIKRESEWKLRDRELGLGRMLRRAEEQATNDPLTKLRNRRFLDIELEQLFAAQQARSEDLSIVMIDVDHFKEHNDTQGHTSGDSILVFVGELLRGAIRPTDHAIRYGGDEFVLLLPDADEQSASAVADRIIKLFAQFAATKKGPTAPPLSLSAGVASLVNSRATLGSELLTRADQAMYEAKKNGKNMVSTAA